MENSILKAIEELGLAAKSEEIVRIRRRGISGTLPPIAIRAKRNRKKKAAQRLARRRQRK
jgi:hypothetical protein